MGFFDKMKEQASQLADKAQEAGKASQAKLEALQARRHADGFLRELGALDYASRSGAPVADSDTRVAQLVEQLKAYEAEYGSLDDSSSSDDDGAST